MSTEEDLANADDVPEISHSDVHYLLSFYGIKSHMISFIHDMVSYDDRVFHIGLHDKYIDKHNNIIPLILKCSIINSFNRIDMQIKFMKRLYDNNVPSPQPIQLKYNNNSYNNNHKYIYVTKNNPLINNNSKYNVNVHCMSYVNGIIASKIDKNNLKFLYNLGTQIGKLSLSLKDFKHNASEFEFIWDLQYVLLSEDKLKYASVSKADLLNIYLNNYRNILLPYIRENKLRSSIIHGDLNDLNMLCDINDNTEIKCFFDFGDCKLSYTIFDIAICCAYFMLNGNKNEILNRMYNILCAYNKVYPLTNNEIDIVFVAICSRILTSVLIGTEKIALHPENREYLEVHSKPGWTFLEQFADTDPIAMAKNIKRKLHASNL